MDKKIAQREVLGANGVKLHTHTCGSGSLVLFLHGFPEFGAVWTKQLREFGRDHLAAAIDLRGYGLSDKPTEVSAYSLGKVVEDIRCVIEALSPNQPAIVVGHDWGGIIGWAFARAYPKMVERLIAINAPHPAIFARELVHNRAQRFASSHMLFFRSPGVAEKTLAAFDYALLRRMVFGRTVRPEAFSAEERNAYIESWKSPGALTGGLNYYRASENFRETRLEDWQISVPTLVLWGDADPILLTGNLRGLDLYVPNLTIHRHPTATHWVVHEEPEWVHGCIRDFIRAVPTAATKSSGKRGAAEPAITISAHSLDAA